MSSNKRIGGRRPDVGEAREHFVSLRFSTGELEHLDAVASEFGLSRANTLRVLVKRAYDDRGPPVRRRVGPRGSQVS